MTRKVTITLIVAALVLGPGRVHAQSQAELWHAFAASLDPGTELNVRLENGQKFRATLVQAGEDALFVQPRTRAAVPVQPVPYEAIAALERRTGDGANAAKAAVIGVAAGAGTFLGLLLFVFAVTD